MPSTESHLANPRAAVLVTGATGGLGRACAASLVASGRRVVVHGRRADAVEQLVSTLGDSSPCLVSGLVADLSDLDEVRQALEETALPALHGIVTNAGLSTTQHRRSAQGFELTFAVNVLAHQLLLVRLAPRVLPRGRVVVLSSGVHDPDNTLARRAGIPVPTWTGTTHLARQDEAPADAVLSDGRLRYSTSKLGNVLQARGLQERLDRRDSRVDVFALDPGLMVDTDLARELPLAGRLALGTLGRLATPFVDNMRLSTTTARIITSLVNDSRWDGAGFAYLDGHRAQPPSPDAQRDDLVDELWREAAELIGLPDDDLGAA